MRGVGQAVTGQPSGQVGRLSEGGWGGRIPEGFLLQETVWDVCEENWAPLGNSRREEVTLLSKIKERLS